MLLAIENISKAFGDNQVLNHVSFSLAYGQKIGLVGANGVGKSTLIKIIIGELESDGGAVQLAGGAEIGYLAQTLSGMEEKTIAQLIDQTLGNLRAIETRLRALEAHMAQPADDLDDLLAEYSALTEQFERRGGYDLEYRLDQVMAGLGIARLARDRRVATLSGGEKSRVGLAALLLAAPDLLLLDEPTNHLDLEMRHALTLALQDYEGALVLVSHDRHLLRTTTDDLFLIADGSLAPFDGDLDDYRAWLSRRGGQGSAAVVVNDGKLARKRQREQEAAQRQLLLARRRPLQKELKSIEHRLSAWQAERASLDQQLADPGHYGATDSAALQTQFKRQAELMQWIEAAEERWLHIHVQLENLGEA